MSRLSKVKYNGQTVAEYAYDQLSRRILLNYGNNTNITYLYDLGDRLTRITNNANSSIDIQYSDYDNVGNRKNMIVDNNQYLFSYDRLYQLIGVDYPAGLGEATEYSYDRLGSRTLVSNSSQTPYKSNRLNQYDRVNNSNLTYDKNGNLTIYLPWKYYYDCENRLTDVNMMSTRKMHCRYDYLGRRISKTTGPNTINFCYDGDNIIAEYDSSGNLLRKYIYGDRIDEPFCMVNISGETETKYYYHFDGLGSVVALSNNDGVIVEQYRYDVFGQPNATGSVGNRYFFTGREYDKESAINLYYYRARFYRPSIGRFLQADPISYNGGLNLYTYVKNNPVKFVDPFGLKESFGDCWNNCMNKMTGGTRVGICGSYAGMASLISNAAKSGGLIGVIGVIGEGIGAWAIGAGVGCSIGCGLWELPLPPDDFWHDIWHDIRPY